MLFFFCFISIIIAASVSGVISVITIIVIIIIGSVSAFALGQKGGIALSDAAVVDFGLGRIRRPLHKIPRSPKP